MANWWQLVINVAEAANRLRVNGEMVRLAQFELNETRRLAMNAECATCPGDAHSRLYCEGKVWAVIPGFNHCADINL